MPVFSSFFFLNIANKIKGIQRKIKGFFFFFLTGLCEFSASFFFFNPLYKTKRSGSQIWFGRGSSMDDVAPLDERHVAGRS